MHALVLLLGLLLGAALAACGSHDPMATDASIAPDSTVRPDGRVIPPPPPCDETDSDGDGIANVIEGAGDFDQDGLSNMTDPDSDNDGTDDADESAPNPCALLDSDGDGHPDSQDLDSDNDGLTDARERELGTRSVDADTDRDMITDLAEVAAGTDPLSSTSRIGEGEFFVVLPYEGEHDLRTLRFNTNIVIADVYFLLDTTRSMDPEVLQIQTGLQRVIIPGIQGLVRDVQFGAGGFDDFPVEPHGEMTDLPFYHLVDTVPFEQDLGSVSGAFVSGSDAPTFAPGPNGQSDIIDAIVSYPRHFGRNFNESGAEALYQVATGEGFSWFGRAIPPRACPSVPDEFAPRRGYPCFRPGALPIVIYVSDACLHQPLPGDFPPDTKPDDIASTTYAGFSPAPHTYAEALARLRGIGARVLTLSTDSIPSAPDYPATAHMCNIARDTGAVRGDGSPLCFQAGPDGTNITREIVDAVTALVEDTPQDVELIAANVAGNPDDFDARMFAASITAIEGYVGPNAGQGYSRKEGAVFYGVIPGTLVEFRIDFYNGVRPQGPTAQVFQAALRVMGNGSALLDSRRVFIVVPPEDYDIILI